MNRDDKFKGVINLDNNNKEAPYYFGLCLAPQKHKPCKGQYECLECEKFIAHVACQSKIIPGRKA